MSAADCQRLLVDGDAWREQLARAEALTAERDQWKELHRALLVEHLELKKKVRAATKPIDPPAFGSPNGA